MRRAEVTVKEEVSQFACPNPACPYYGKRPAEGGKLWLAHAQVDKQRTASGRVELVNYGACN